MKIEKSKSASAAGGPRATKGPAGAGGFSLGAASATAEAHGVAPSTNVGGVASLGALLALQAVEDPLQSRRRQVVRAGRILDALDGLKIALLETGAAPGDLEKLMAAVREERAATDEPRLQEILNEIETRAAVELAKAGGRFAA